MSNKNISNAKPAIEASNGMEEAIRGFSKQFAWTPEVLHAKNMRRYERVIVCGMGGSHLAADILAFVRPDLRITVWSDYGLPYIPKSEIKKTLVILSSYSGNTEETIDAFHTAKKMGMQYAVIAAGGKLISLAEKENIPAVVMPNAGLQPRAALGLSIKGLMALLGEKRMLREISQLSQTLKPERFEAKGKALAKALHGKVPVIYASHKNYAVVYNWKIKFNETGKIPAFCNVLPELNHNEMTGFDMTPKSKALAKNISCIMLTDSADHLRVAKRMKIVSRLYRARGIPVQEVKLTGANPFIKIFSSLILADWIALYTARTNGADPTEVPMVEEFKTLMLELNYKHP